MDDVAVDSSLSSVPAQYIFLVTLWQWFYTCTEMVTMVTTLTLSGLNQAHYPYIKKPGWLKEEGRNINSAKVHD